MTVYLAWPRGSSAQQFNNALKGRRVFLWFRWLVFWPLIKDFFLTIFSDILPILL